LLCMEPCALGIMVDMANPKFDEGTVRVHL